MAPVSIFNPFLVHLMIQKIFDEFLQDLQKKTNNQKKKDIILFDRGYYGV